ncbi:hypothetical protein HUW86_11360 [Fusobacterium sp. SB021]|uniref:hypothetical protein n=1 Tax=Fusobacterium sp. SB021 TaxID=2744227 RepID=UPI003CF83A17
MRIVKLNENYLEEILKINGHINKKGIGLALNIKDNFIFIPITSQIKYDSEKLKHLDYPLFNIGDKRKYGTLVIIVKEFLENKFLNYFFMSQRILKENIE